MRDTPSIKSREMKIIHNMPISKTLKFWEGLKEGKIYGTKCVKCGKLYFPPVIDCGECLSSEIEWVRLGDEAEIETFTQIVARPVTFCESDPYIVAIGRLKEGVKVLAWLNGLKPPHIKIGMKVKLQAKVFPDGNLAFEFTPLK